MKRTSYLSILLALGTTFSFFFGTTARVPAQDQPTDVQQAMSPAEFKAAGLQKLTPEELAKLNAWLKGYRETAEKTAEKKAERKASEKVEREKLNLIVSRVDGVWNGIGPGEVIQLEDGSKWKLANKDEHYGGNADHPAVAVYKAAFFGWKMRVSRIAEFYVMPVH